MIADVSFLDGFIYSGMAGGALGALIGVFITFQFQKKLLRQQLDFQQRLLDQQLAAQEQGHKEHLAHLTKLADGECLTGTVNRQVLFDASKAIVTAIEKMKS